LIVAAVILRARCRDGDKGSPDRDERGAVHGVSGDEENDVCLPGVSMPPLAVIGREDTSPTEWFGTNTEFELEWFDRR